MRAARGTRKSRCECSQHHEDHRLRKLSSRRQKLDRGLQRAISHERGLRERHRISARCAFGTGCALYSERLPVAENSAFIRRLALSMKAARRACCSKSALQLHGARWNGQASPTSVASQRARCALTCVGRSCAIQWPEGTRRIVSLRANAFIGSASRDATVSQV